MGIPAWWPLLGDEEIVGQSGRSCAWNLLRRAGLIPGWQVVGRLCTVGHIEVRRCDLGASGLESVVIPSDRPGHLTIGVSSRPTRSPTDVLFGERAVVRETFRVAHELGHALTFDRRRSTVRRASTGSADEERFCDDFAVGLLVQGSFAPALPASAVGLREAARRSGLPLRAVARELVTQRPGLSVALAASSGRQYWIEGSGTRSPSAWCLLPGGRRVTVGGLRTRRVQLSLPAVA